MRRHLRFTYAIVVSAVGTAALIGAGGTPTLGQTAAPGPVVKPTISNWQFITAGTPPPTQAASMACLMPDVEDQATPKTRRVCPPSRCRTSIILCSTA